MITRLAISKQSEHQGALSEILHTESTLLHHCPRKAVPFGVVPAYHAESCEAGLSFLLLCQLILESSPRGCRCGRGDGRQGSRSGDWEHLGSNSLGDAPHTGEGHLFYPVHPLMVLIFSGNTLRDISRNNVLPAIWLSLSPVKLKHKNNHP